eukprot:Em0006g1270a
MQEGYIYIKTHLNGFVLDVDGGNEANGAKVISRPVASQPADNQLWRLDYQPDKTFLVVSKLAGGKVLDCSNQKQGTQLVVCERHGGESQRWKREGDHLTSMSGLVADISGCNKSPGAAVVLWSKHKMSHQANCFRSSRGMILDVAGCHDQNGAKVTPVSAVYPPAPNQKWYLDYQQDDTFFIVSMLNGKVMDCGSGEKGSHLVVWERHGGKNQLWKRDGQYLVSLQGNVLDIANSSLTRGAPVVVSSKNTPVTDNQLFELKIDL